LKILIQKSAIPPLIDLAAMRDTIKKLGGDPQSLNPVCPVDLLMDQSIQIDIAKK